MSSSEEMSSSGSGSVDFDLEDAQEACLGLVAGVQEIAKAALANNYTGWVRANASVLNIFLTVGMRVSEGKVTMEFSDKEMKKKADKKAKGKDASKAVEKLKKTMDSTLEQVEAAALIMDSKGLVGLVGGSVDYSFLGTGLEFIFEFDLGTVTTVAKKRTPTPKPSKATEKLVESATSGLSRTVTEMQAKGWTGTVRAYASLGSHSIMMGAAVLKMKGLFKKSRAQRAKEKLPPKEALPKELQAFVEYYEDAFSYLEQNISQVQLAGLSGSVGINISISAFGLAGVRFMVLADIHSIATSLGLDGEEKGFFRNPFRSAPPPPPKPSSKKEKKNAKATEQALDIIKETRDVLAGRCWKGTIRTTAKIAGFGLVVWALVAEKDFEDKPRNVSPDTSTPHGQALKHAIGAVEMMAPYLNSDAYGGILGGGINMSALGTGVDVGFEVEVASVMTSIQMVDA